MPHPHGVHLCKERTIEAISIIVLVGGVTFYGGPFEGKPLYCGGTYAPETGPWVALPVEWYESGKVKCGDVMLIQFGDGGTQLVRALDAGRLNDFRVWDTGKRFVADLPRYWRGRHRTMTGSIANLSVYQ